MHHEPSAFKLRVMLAGLVVAYGLTQYVQWWYAPFLSIETRHYQEIATMVMSGLSLKFAVQKLFWLLANVLGALGIALMFFRNRSGLPMLLACPPLLIAATVLGAPEAAFPGIELTAAKLLWCATAAIWGCVVTYALVALVGDKILFSKRAEDSATGQPIEGMHHIS
jgi:hypothetical protein